MGPKRAAKKRQKPEVRYEITYKNALSDDILTEAATFYSKHYVAYSDEEESSGESVTITPTELKQKLWPSEVTSWQDQALIQAYLGDEDDPSTQLIGQLFLTKWTWKERLVLWITQLCVHTDQNVQTIAGKLIQQILEEAPVLYEEGEDWIIGITALQPAALIEAATRLGKRGSESPNGLKNVLDHAYATEAVESIIQSSPVEALRNGKLKAGFAGEEEMSSGPRVLDTGLFVEHVYGPDFARSFRLSRLPFTDLPDRCEYVLVFDGI